MSSGRSEGISIRNLFLSTCLHDSMGKEPSKVLWVVIVARSRGFRGSSIYLRSYPLCGTVIRHMSTLKVRVSTKLLGAFGVGSLLRLYFP